MKNKELTYTEAMDEIKSIIEQMENSELNIDVLCKDVERSIELIRFCRSKLHTTEENINKLLDDTELN
ncbi:MAG: exodeoxyribonuclease VII small subunit [Prevotellaceae bacterium]|jgi:exodeoxyribonuclease VII small subunit|nr:exodeoxyribonuclease VII small subunit [Prevotellaceae bacterium]